MKRTLKLLPIELSLIIGMLLSIIACYSSVIASSEGISNKILRFHIIANSDDDLDQNLKLLVRDEILNNFDFNNLDNLDMAKEDIYQKLPQIEKLASDIVKREGFSYKVKASVVNMWFDTRYYNAFTMPAGYYDALRITIGKASGHNWWCVLYPPLCIGAAQPQQELKDTLDENQQELVNQEEQYDVRFAAIEIIEKFKSMFKD